MIDNPGDRVDSLSVVPKYYQLKDILLRKIEDGVWKPKEAIPAERDLEETYRVSRTTVRKALDILVTKGYLYREHGRGTFVAFPRLQQSLHSLSSFTEDMCLRGLEPGQKIFAVEWVVPSRRVFQALQMDDPSENVLRIYRLRLANAVPIGIHESYIHIQTETHITEETLQQHKSLYELLGESFGITVVEADETIKATIADEVEAKLLAIEIGSPLLKIERTAWAQNRQPVEFVSMLYRADWYSYYVRLSKE